MVSDSEEDFFGDMDFKVSGTTEGISSIQVDTKIKGLSFNVIESKDNTLFKYTKKLEGEVTRIEKKLSNAGFVAKAPETVMNGITGCNNFNPVVNTVYNTL